ncbi:MAG: GNAT family N-acetyltransferase [Alphaproteobacteria bacterium]|nr:GNAT family N-acetyltransferase [Alphaproteobacteria bacterium]
MTTDDAEALSRFTDEIADEGIDTVSGQRYTVEQEREFLEQTNAKERSFFLAALDGPRVVGLLNLRVEDKPHYRHAGHLGMAVTRQYRHIGIGRRLLETAIHETEGWPGFCRIELIVTPWNAPAIKLYRSMGFVQEGIIRKAAKLRTAPHDMILMALVW